MTAVLRAHAAVNQAGIAGAGRLERAPNTRNELWFIGPYVLRIRPVNGERRPLMHERKFLEVLEGEVPAPALVSYGEAAFGEWLVVQRVPGNQLSRTWPTMTAAQREEAMKALGQALRNLHRIEAADHAIPPPPAAGERRLDWPHQLPAGRLLQILDRAARLRYVDPEVIRGAAEIVRSGASALDDVSGTLVHGDLHFENVLWDGEQLTAIVDWEWGSVGPPDLDLDVLLHSLAHPSLHVGADYASAVHRSDFEEVAGWLRSAYPELFAHPRLAERLVIYRLSYDVRELVLQPPEAPADTLSPYHPYQRIRRIVEGRSDLNWILVR